MHYSFIRVFKAISSHDLLANLDLKIVNNVCLVPMLGEVGMEEGRIGSIGHGPEFFIGLSDGMTSHLRGVLLRKGEVLYVQLVGKPFNKEILVGLNPNVAYDTHIGIGTLRGFIHPSADTCHSYLKEYSPEKGMKKPR